jgi:hypothetical protein
MTEEEICAADASLLRMVQEAREIACGQSDAVPTKEHLNALLLSLQFYKAQAADAQLPAPGRGELVYLPDLESNCYQCDQRAQYVVIGLATPVLFCSAHARRQPQSGRLQ